MVKKEVSLVSFVCLFVWVQLTDDQSGGPTGASEAVHHRSSSLLGDVVNDGGHVIQVDEDVL